MLRDRDDRPVDHFHMLEAIFKGAGASDGDEVEVSARRTGRRPHGDRRVVLVSPHTYEREAASKGGE